jgi:hypothetical protein
VQTYLFPTECAWLGKRLKALMPMLVDAMERRRHLDLDPVIKSWPRKKDWLRRRQAVEPVIGHLKSDHRMDRRWLKGALGDALHTIRLTTISRPCEIHAHTAGTTGTS